MKIKPKNIFFNLYLKNYLNKYQNQLKPIVDLRNTPTTFLVISNTALGDTLLSTPAIKSLKKSFPNSKVVTLIHKKYIPLFKNFKYIDKIIPFYGGYKKFLKTIKTIKKLKPEMTLIFHGNGPQDIQLAIFSGSNYILKHPNNSPLKRYLSFDFKDKHQHTIEDRLDLIRKIGGKHIEKTMCVGDLKNQNIEKKFNDYKDLIGFQIGAANIYKMWPIENFIVLAKKIDKKIVITGIQSEWKLAEKIKKEVGKKIINLCGKCTIEELPYLIKNLKLLITNDTGTMHLAIALKIPTISLFSPTLSQGIGPYQDMNRHKVIQKNANFIQKLPKKQRDNSAMRLITVDEVYATYKKAIDENMHV